MCGESGPPSSGKGMCREKTHSNYSELNTEEPPLFTTPICTRIKWLLVSKSVSGLVTKCLIYCNNPTYIWQCRYFTRKWTFSWNINMSISYFAKMDTCLKSWFLALCNAVTFVHICPIQGKYGSSVGQSAAGVYQERGGKGKIHFLVLFFLNSR